MANWLEPLRRGAEEVIETLSEGWERLRQRSSGALTRFRRRREGAEDPAALPAVEETWGLLSAEVAETKDGLVVRVEAPGMNEEDFHISVDGNVLAIRGEKRFEREDKDANYYLFESAYGSFERRLPLPFEVKGDDAKARYRRGVLTIELPRVEGPHTRRIPVKG